MMKTLLYASLTLSLLSFNAFADEEVNPLLKSGEAQTRDHRPLDLCKQQVLPTGLKIELIDGSLIKARPSTAMFSLRPLVSDTPMQVKWADIKTLKQHEHKGRMIKGRMILEFTNGDHLSGHWIKAKLQVVTSFAHIAIPSQQIRSITKTNIHDAALRPPCATHICRQSNSGNIALGKPVSGKDGASHGKGLAKHLTDGDYSTHTKPPAFNFDYQIDLRGENGQLHSISKVKIHWQEFGDRFNGIPGPNGKGWASGSWPGDYVKSYQLEYRSNPDAPWLKLHRCSTSPANEDAKHVIVHKAPASRAGCSSAVTTTIHNLDLTNVGEIRIRAQGGHWIGLYELEVFGQN